MLIIGVTTIVSLMTEDEVVNCNFKPYKEIATEYATERQRAVEFISFPIPGLVWYIMFI